MTTIREQMDIKSRNSDEIAGMFDRIAPRYDLLNRLLSLRTDIRWRRKAIRVAGRLINPDKILDVATGTGDLAIESLRLNPMHVTGVDISEQMLAIGESKIREKRLTDKIDLIKGAAEYLPFSDATYDLVTVAFGVRNFSDPLAGLSQIYRVLRRGGFVVILEFSTPAKPFFKGLYSFYFRKLLPLLGKLLSGDKDAYRYLPESVSAFPEGDGFKSIMIGAGFSNITTEQLSGGIATLYTGEK